MRIDRVLAPAFLILTASSAALAARLDYTAEIGYLHSDNINLSAVDPVAENLLIPQLAFRFSEDGSVVRAQVNGLVEYRDYLGGAFGNEFRGTLDGVVDWTLIPERLKWSFADSLGLNPINLRLPDSPDNLQQTNVFSTGPTLQFRLGQSTMGQAELRYTDSYAQTTDEFNSGRLSAALRALKDLDSTRRLSANLEASKINYDNNSHNRTTVTPATRATPRSCRSWIWMSRWATRADFDRGEHINAALIRANELARECTKHIRARRLPGYFRLQPASPSTPTSGDSAESASAVPRSARMSTRIIVLKAVTRWKRCASA
jgi:hypothetical protein